MTAVASTTTTAASGGTNASADLAQNGVAAAFTTLGGVVIAESGNGDFKTSGTLILTAPSGWLFNTAAAISATPGKVGGGTTPNDISASVGAITASSITVNITVNAMARLDNLTLSGIQVQATEGGNLPVAGNILRTAANPGSAVIVGVSNDVTNFGSLSQALGALRLFVLLPGQSLTDGSTVASSGISGSPANQAAGVGFNLAQLVAADREFNAAATYSGAKTIAWSGPGGSPIYTTNVSFTGGHSTTTLATTLRKAETTTLGATSATSPAIGTALPSASFTVDPGPVTKLQLLLPGETAAPGTTAGKTGVPTVQTSSVTILNNVRVNAVDANWNAIGGAAPDVAINSSDAAATIADDNGAAGGNLSLVAGSGTLSSFTFGTGGGPQTVTATDVAAGLSAGTSASVTVNKSASATSLSSSQNPSVLGQSVTFTATVTGGVGTPTGTVNFKDGSTVIGSALPLDGSGVVAFTTSSLTAATHTISAVFSGSTLYNASTSANLSQVVNKISTATALVSSLNPACAGQPVTLTATVSVVAPGSGVPAGSVDFKDGTNVIGTISLNASAVATLTTSSLSSTTHNLTAVYKGNGSFNTSTSTPALVQAVKPKPSASVSGSASICPGGFATIRANLGGTSPWTVTWSDGLVQSGITVNIASRSVSPSVTTVFTVTNVADATCSNSGTGSATVTVNAPPAISAQPSSKSACAGSTTTFTVAASGTSLTYRWRKNGVNLVNGGHISGATNATLTISSAATADEGSYDVVISGACPPSLASNAASLTVMPLPVATITADSALCALSTGNSASVPDAGAGASYAWTTNGGTITGGGATPIVTFTAGASKGSMTLSVTVTSASGCSAASNKDIALSTGDVVIEDWKNIPVGTESWQSATLSAKDMTYPEGGTIPYRLTLPQPCVGSTWSITLQYDFVDLSSGVHFCDFLTSYNAYEGSVNGKACTGGACTGESTFPIPADGDLSYQLPGVFTVENGTITSVSAYSTTPAGGGLQKRLTLTGTAKPGADVMILFGAHMARDYEWGNGNGAHEWPTGTANLGFSNYSAGTTSSGGTNVKISDNILDNPSQSDLSVVATDSPDPVNAGQNLTYNIIVSNSGPLSSISDSLTDAIPAGTTFVSATAPAGWTMTTPAVGGTGIVRWFRPTSFAAGAGATFGMVVAVNSNAVGTVENTAVLTAGNVDAYLFNNSAHTSTIIFGACSAPVVSSAPASVNVCVGGTASFSASATGTPAPAIQWQVMPTGGGSFGDLIGETAGSLSFAAIASQSGNQYRARFSNACGTTFSAPATLNWCPGNTAPVVTITGPPNGLSFAVGTPVTFAGSFTDAVGDTHIAVWTIGGVDVPGVVNDTTQTVAASYAFSTAGNYAIKLTVTDQDGASGISTQVLGQTATVTVSSPTSGGDENRPRLTPASGARPALDVQFGLAQNAPNPFRSGTQIRFSLAVQSRVKLGVFDVAGRQVVSLSDQVWDAGSHALDWSGTTDGGSLARGGFYVIRMVAQSTTGDRQYRAQKTMVRIN
jgi:uncharacterized repeat protein (TIGR01451 family)